VGIGFAVPSNMAKQVFDQLVKNGKVSRGYMGVSLGDVPADAARMLDLKGARGAEVSLVNKGGPGDKAGLKPGDIIVAIDGKTINAADELTMAVISHQPGQTVDLDVVRDGKAVNMKVTLGQRPGGLEVEKGDDSDDNSAKNGDNNDGDSVSVRGIHVEGLTADIAQELGVPSSTKGVVITGVDADNVAADVVTQGMVIIAVNKQPVASLQDFKRLMNAAQGKEVLLTFNFRGQVSYTVLPPK
jgi:serine protease Do